MTENLRFLPDWASPPGDTIVDLLDERGLSQPEFAQRLGRALSFVNQLVAGQVAITLEIAKGLEGILGVPASFWINRECQYLEDLARLRATESANARAEWVRRLPLKEMVDFGWIEPVGKSIESAAVACLRFFDVPNIRTWCERYSDALELAAFRTSPSLEAQPAAVAAWLRRGEIVAAGADCRPWDAEQVRTILPQIRALTRVKDPGLFVPELIRLCADCGVVVAIVRTPKGCRASGATRFVAPDKAVLQLSFRYLSDDHFWFTFFHEVAHLLLQSHASIHLEGTEEISTKEEQEANDFAADLLIPAEARSAMRALPLEGREVIRFATRIGISPGIVVGQLQHDGLITRRQLNELKRRYRWES